MTYSSPHIRVNLHDVNKHAAFLAANMQQIDLRAKCYRKYKNTCIFICVLYFTCIKF